MKKGHKPKDCLNAKAICLLILLVSGILIVSCGGGGFTLAEKGNSSYVIILADNPSPSERRAAQELQKFVKLAAEAELPIIGENDPRAQKSPRIIIGSGKISDSILAKGKPVDFKALGDEGFILRTVHGNGSKPDVVIAGGRLRGAMYGVYTFLDRLGFRWYTSRVTRFPEGKVIRLSDLDERIIPPFMYREPFIKEAFDGDWAARNRVNSGAAELDSTRGGKLTVLGVHTFDQLIPPSLFKEHPEYFPLIGGKRVTGYVQRCLTNPEVVEIAARNIIAWMDREPSQRIFSLDQNDVEKNCECPSCKKIMDEEGAPSGLYVTFVNRVAEIVEKKHPENYVSTLAYMFTEKPPKTVKPRKNVLIRLCPIYMCVGHPFTECTSKETKQFNETLAGWGKLTDRIFIWHYSTNFSNYLMPFPNFIEFTRAIKTYSESGVKGIFFQGGYTSLGSSDADLRAWVMARLLWKPSDNPDDVVNEWMHGVYGKAFIPMRAVYDLMHSRVADPNRHLRIFDAPTSDFWPDSIVASMDSLYGAAESLAAGDSTATYYVRKNRMSVKYLQFLRNSGRLEVVNGVYKPVENSVKLKDYDDFVGYTKEFGVTALREEPFDCNLFTLLRQRLEEHPVETLENADLRLDIVPDLGGRIVNIIVKNDKVNVLGKTDRDNYFYPAYGGYDESTTRTWASTGFAQSYKVERKGLSLHLTGKESNGLVFSRVISLSPKGTKITIVSSLLNTGNQPRTGRLVCKMELNSEPRGTVVETREKDGSFKQEEAADFYRDGANKPSGAWRAENKSLAWIMENRFSSESIEACHLIADKKAQTVSMEIFSFERDLPPKGKTTITNTWEIKKK